ncbi:MAG: aminopeptidase [Acidaminococcaceae bacterium]|nr:aminopeptidase [Acidaminococcaceae bacterium]HAY61212.1 aminopeptidase [Acidaminococcaceae bacterium]HCJ90919.1 aminopeptidase [Acidaminococcaceae bacterium]
MEKKNTWKTYTAKQLKDCDAFCKGYIDFLSDAKTEREAVEVMEGEMKAAGYRPLDEYIAKGTPLKKGDKVYRINMKKGVVMFNMGSDDLEEGLNILGAHIDSPRLDIKSDPLYEDGGFALLDTHYYGGIKKYQWVTLPLAIHGVIARKDGTVVKVAVGEKPEDPVFFVSDLLIHLAQEQMVKPAASVIEGEALDVIVGNRPLRFGKAAKDAKEKDTAAKDAVKKGVLDILKKQYGVTEEDFLSAELEVVPAGRAREAGFDRSMILSYGQDDRVCAYGSFEAMLDVKTVKRTACCILVDKEEIGSVGATGMQSKFFENTVAELLALAGKPGELALRRCLAHSTMLSSDVSSAFDPLYAQSFDKKNVAFLGGGMVLNKFTGARGKSGSNDANAEYIAQIRKIYEAEQINFQMAELGKVDLGGGGTIAYIMALYGMNVIDSGVAVLSMHSPWEATSKADVYETMRGYKAFLQKAQRL